MTDIEYRAVYTTPYRKNTNPHIPYHSEYGTSKEEVIRKDTVLRTSEETLATILHWETRLVARTPWMKEEA